VRLNPILIQQCYNKQHNQRRMSAIATTRLIEHPGAKLREEGNTVTEQLHLKRFLALALALLLASCASGLSTSSLLPAGGTARPAAAALPPFKHIFVIVMENKEYDQVIGSPSAPYLNALAQHYGLATNYYGIRHPSLPNYLALTGGSTFGITSDCIDCTIAQPNLVDQLETAGKSWKAYIESMPNPCYIGDAPPLYRQKHNPFIYYDNVRTNPDRCAKVVPFTQFTADAAAKALPDFVWISPNMCNDSHDCPSAAGDTWLQRWVPAILGTPEWKDNGVLFITFDEGEHALLNSTGCCREGNGGHVATLVISPLSKPGYQSLTGYDHYSLLRTIEDAWGLPELTGAACDCTPAMADFFVPNATARR
jgi:phosphatidylinositol-3-phosphatase